MRNSDQVDTSRLSNSHWSIRVFLYTHRFKLYVDHITYCPNWTNFESERGQEQTKITLNKLRGIVLQSI